jgi:hypothetical protein
MLHYFVVPRDGPALLHAMMRLLAGGAQISFEGYFNGIDLSAFGPPIADGDTVLRRQGISSPVMDWLVLPLESETQADLWKALAASGALRREGAFAHVQIAREGKLAFGTYDNFHPQCTEASEAVPAGALEGLERTGVIKSFEVWTPALRERLLEEIAGRRRAGR